MRCITWCVILTLSLEEGARLGSSGLDLGRYMLVVAVLIGALVGAGFLLRRVVAGSLKSRAAKRSLSIVDVLPLGGRRQLAVVRCYDRTFALGLGDKDVHLVAELDAVIGAEGPPADGEADTSGFDALLTVARTRLAQRRRGETPPPLPAKDLVRTEEPVG